MRYCFHVNIFADPYACTWEDAAEKLEQLPRMVFEPDGSWIWSGEADADRWQVDGHLFDFDGNLHRVELHGTCPRNEFDRLLNCFGWPEVELTFEMVREGVRVDEATFRHGADSC
jgi:hypothetical protein